MTSPREAAEFAQFLTFSVASEEYGLSILSVREILEYDTVTRVPRTPDFIRGVINLRGRVVPVLDLAVRFGLPPSPVTKRSCVLIAEVALDGEPTVMGIVADSVSQVIELGPDEIEPPPSFGTRARVEYLRGMGRSGKRFVLLLDVDRVLSTSEAEALGALGAADADASAVSAPAAAGAVATTLLALLLATPSARAGEPIQDNSFLIEEAYNQERGVVQHINALSWSEASGDWIYTFTQEWPLRGQRHQLSFTLPVQQLHGSSVASTGLGDVSVSYRYQALGVGGGGAAFAPRVSVLVPTGKAREQLGAGGVGLQVNLPLSWAVGSKLATHWNAGATHTWGASDGSGGQFDTNAWFLGQSLVWLCRPRLNVLVETVWVQSESVTGPGVTERSRDLLVSPGIRWAHDLKSGLQVVPGIAFPIGLGPSRGERGLFLYLSFEHAFRKPTSAP